MEVVFLSHLHSISGCENEERQADVIFVHGLGGDAIDTWRHANNSEYYWPSWIGQDFPEVGVWSLGYAASISKWPRFRKWFPKSKRESGYAMALPDRARQVLDLMVQHNLGPRPIMFVCHSLGGLLTKQILRMASDEGDNSPERLVFESTRAVLFLATPHQGADLATLVAKFRLAFPTLAIEDLKAHNAHLRDLFEWYRNHVDESIKTRTYYESRRVKDALLIVNPSSSHPGVGANPIPLDEDHLSIAKPVNRNSQVYTATKMLLQECLIDPPIFQGYRKDIEVLSKQTKATLTDLSELSILRVGKGEIKVIRRCVHEIRDQIEEQSIVVVGEPGTGKSGVLYDLVNALIEEGRDTVFLAVDHITAKTHSELKEQLGINHELEEVLTNWNGDKPAFLIIDALDAARSEQTVHLLTTLLARVVRRNDRWNVITSIRKFDLRHNREIRNIFSGQPPIEEYCDFELKNTCHVQIPEFSDEELSIVSQQSLLLQTLIETADETMKQLLHVPFNLRLMGELIGEGTSIVHLTPIRTQLELLDRYWEERIIQPHDGRRDAREDILRYAVSYMVKHRTLRVPRGFAATPESTRELDQILSKHVLIEWQPSLTFSPDSSNLTFAHHVLFDYAVERMLIRSQVDVTQMLASDPNLVLIIRPSFDMHFQHVWSQDHSRSHFWNLVFRFMKSVNIPEIAKLVGPVTAARFSVSMSDLSPVIQGIECMPTKSIGEEALLHTVRALSALESTEFTNLLTGKTASPWAELVEHLSKQLSDKNEYIIRILLSLLCKHLTNLTTKQLEHVGAASRNYLDYVWSRENSLEGLVTLAIPWVCQTYHSNIIESSSLLKRVLQKERLSNFGYLEIPWLAYNVKNIMNYDPAFVKELYISAFSYIEDSKDTTTLGGSKILSLRSNRRQDYESGLYQLAEDFTHFIEIAPIEAITALITIVENHVLTKQIYLSVDELQDNFLVDGINAIIYADNSYIWDTGIHSPGDEINNMLDAFQAYLTGLSKDLSKIGNLQQIVIIFIKHNRMAVLWRRLLISGTYSPSTLGLEIRFLGWTLPVLKCQDTSNVVGDYLGAVYSYLSLEDRQKIEFIIHSIPSTLESENLLQGERIRDRLLKKLPLEYVCTSDTRERISELNLFEKADTESPDFPIWESSEYSSRDYLADEGVPVDEAANLRIQELELPVKLFCEEHRNSHPTLEAVKLILPNLRELWEALSNAETDGVHPKQHNHSWGYLAEACSRATKCGDINYDEEMGKFLLSVLLAASQNPEPMSSSHDDQFDETPSWGKPAARIDAAEALTELARFQSFATPGLLAIMEELIIDPVPAVRYQVTIRLLNLYSTANSFMWGLIDRVVNEETNRGVLHGLVQGVLTRLTARYPDKINALAGIIYDRTAPGNRLRHSCIDIFERLYIFYNHSDARVKIQNLILNPLTNTNESRYFVVQLRDAFISGFKEQRYTKTEYASIRKRSWDILLQILQEVKVECQSLVEQAPKDDVLSKELQQKHSDIIEIVDAANMAVYFSSGAHDKKNGEDGSVSNSFDFERVKVFFTEADKVLDELADFSIPGVTHHLLQTLEFLVPVDPVAIFMRIVRTIRVGQSGEYQLESMGADLLVRLIERYMAEYRIVFRDNPDCLQSLIEVLDIFVKAGWSSAQRLTYRMEEIFR
ncbi:MULTISPECIES: ATP-binding protein [Paenibacillus]|nr:ATP-binding protein [Paenibacillus borealis]